MKVAGRSRGAAMDGRQVPRVALLGSGTVGHLPQVLASPCAAYGLHPQWYVAPYQQYHQEALHRSSGLATFDPHVTIVMVDAQALLHGDEITWFRLSQTRRRRAARSALQEFLHLVEAVVQRTRGLVLVHNLEVPADSPLGILETKQPFGVREMVQWINRQLARHFRDHARVFVFDYDGFLSRLGKDEAHDARLLHLADLRVGPQIWQQLGEEYARYLLALQGRIKKCLVVDLDNTLWGGVIGEDGFERIQLGPTPPGNAFVALQRHLLALFERGVLLAVNSAHHASEALTVIREHPAMVLREEHFAALAINWESKVENLRAIARELNLGLESLVFLDDDPVQRGLVRTQLPEVQVVELPQDPSGYVHTLKRLVAFDTLQLTPEDHRRGAMYIEERHRRESAQQAASVEEFLRQLEIQIRFRAADRFLLPRLAQLTQRTHQFHVTLDRYTEAELEQWLELPERQMYAIEVADRFGDQGVSGAVGVSRAGTSWNLAPFLFSCRVLGKGVERAVLATLARLAQAEGIRELQCRYAPSEKNEPARRFLQDVGFQCTATEGPGSQVWRVVVAQVSPAPSFIRVSVP